MHKTINIKEDMPSVDYALFCLEKEIMFAKAQSVSVLIVIHGYGSNGEKGLIRTGAHKFLDRWKKEGKIRDFIPGEKWGELNQSVVNLKSFQPQLIVSSQLKNLNSGVTIVWVS